ncbi:MAG: hypothetical protein P4L28_05290 [Paludibacteraceae bacterium]|nr:hypothetical protein [Paludibacteraceae bacterium]
MKNRNKLQPIILLLLLLSTLNACAKSTKKNSKVNVSQPKTGTVVAPTPKATANIQAELNRAKKAGKAVFLIVTATGVPDAGKALTLANKTNEKYKNATVVTLNRDDAANANLVNQWRLVGAPLPLILVVSPKGTPVGGLELKEATVEKLLNIVPTPKEDEVYAALNNKKSVFVVIAKKTNTDRAIVLEKCKAANTQLKSAGTIIEIDPTDAKEQKFIKMLNYKNTPNTSSVFVFNASGQSTGTFSGEMETKELVTAATKVIRSCCAGGGSCSPKK